MRKSLWWEGQKMARKEECVCSSLNRKTAASFPGIWLPLGSTLRACAAGAKTIEKNDLP